MLSALTALAGCGASVESEASDPDPPSNNDPTCPAAEPVMLGGCDSPDLVCSYGDAMCTRALSCVGGQWSFESGDCNVAACPASRPENGDACQETGVQCVYGTPVPNDTDPCVNASWSEATCSAQSGTWEIGWYDSVCPPGCPSDVPVKGDPCNITLWAPSCTFEVDAACGKATVTAACVTPSGQTTQIGTWDVSDPACAP